MVQETNKFSQQNLQSSEYQTSQKYVEQDNDVSLSLTGFGDEVKIQIKSPKGISKVPNSICYVVDVSASMSSLAGTKKEDNTPIELGYSIFDIVKHSLNTVVESLDENDNFSLVTFSDRANERLNFESMNVNNKVFAKNLINNCYTQYGTNIWRGIELGLEVMKKSLGFQRHQSLIVLTDGQSNVNPRLGVLPTLTNYYKSQFIDRKPTINTFGFGYQLDSELLQKIAYECQGYYSFIPDSAFVGTVFTNSIAAMQSTYATNTVLIFRPLHQDAKLDISQIKSNFKTTMNHLGEVCVELGNLLFDQSKDILFSQKLKSEILKDYQVEVQYFKQDLSLQQQRFFKTASSIENANEFEFISEKLRLEVVETINNCNGATDNVQKDVQNMINKLQQTKYNDNEYIKALHEDMNGQVKIAVSRSDYFSKWGCHYLPSLSMAHTHKICTNFKDPGIQGYAGGLFSKQRDEIEKVFMSIPPRRPQHSYNSNIPSGLYNETFFKIENPCFDGNNEVQMADGSLKKIKDIKKGDRVFCPNSGQSEEVKCVIETQIKNKLIPMVRIGQNLLITPYHPVRIQGKWVFPSDIAQAKIASCPSVYSFLLESGHTMKINGVECVTFAHGFSQDVVKHDYFGSQKIVNDLRWMKGWWKGHIKLSDQPAIRDSHSGLVIGLRNNRKWMANLQDFKQNSISNMKMNRFYKLLGFSKKIIRI